jgi:glyoxylase-like metal-dependent hydrolase (beta-lactamase superfamily II)
MGVVDLEITKGIFRADKASNNIAHSNIYVVENDEGLAIIDTGTPGNAKKIIEFIQEIGHQADEVRTIILTHSHLDHIGSLKELRDLTGAKVAASEEDAEYISRKKPYPKPKNPLMRLAPLILRTQPVEVDLLLKDGDKIGNLLVVLTPGHTPGSIMLYDEKRKTLFAGDTLRFKEGKILSGQYSWDATKERASVKKISGFDFDFILPGHGEYLGSGAANLVVEYLHREN